MAYNVLQNWYKKKERKKSCLFPNAVRLECLLFLSRVKITYKELDQVNKFMLFEC